MSYILGLYFEQIYGMPEIVVFGIYIALGIITSFVCLWLSPYIHRLSFKFNIMMSSIVFTISYLLIVLIDNFYFAVIISLFLLPFGPAILFPGAMTMTIKLSDMRGKTLLTSFMLLFIFTGGSLAGVIVDSCLRIFPGKDGFIIAFVLNILSSILIGVLARFVPDIKIEGHEN
mmetsp:Transcript_8378/g.1128  ORF Transcript_8378/g.1128 Transcript_8378/m.1128 type:complete len:173 (+) Transcript_8378:117-635(+)